LGWGRRLSWLIFMTSNLLEQLVSTGVLTRQMAEKVLSHAGQNGMATSISLLTLTTLGEDCLAQFLSRQLDRPCFEPRRMQELPPVLREFLSIDQALKYRVLPLRLEQQGLVVAMADPSDKQNLHLLAELIGYPPIPLVAPELRLLQAIQRCYGMELPDHEQSLLEKKRSAANVPSTLVEEAPDEALLEEAEIVEDEPLQRPEEPAADLNSGLAEARCRDDVADALMAHLAGQFDRLALFLYRNGVLQGWRALVGHTPLPGFSESRLSTADSTILQSVLTDQSPFLGRIFEPNLRAQLSRALGAAPERVSMLPLILAGRSVGLLYVEDAGHNICERVAELRNLLAKTACALEILILRQKLARH